jgi:uncharacterized protein YbjQ (UPF0145 family)
MPFWFWKTETPEEKQRKQLQEQKQRESISALQSGDIPSRAKERIQQYLESGSSMFSSDLSAREFLLTREAGFEPISQVMGTSFFSVSFWGNYAGPWRETGEMTNLTYAQNDARSKALQRMQQEAKLLGASGIIGVRIHAKPSNLGSRMTEFSAYGTAVRVPGYAPNQEPFTTSFNGQEFWQLYKAGYIPRGVVMGCCSYYIYSNFGTNMQMNGLFGFGNFNNQEIDLYTNGFIDARNRAISRLTQEISTLQSDGCVGMEITYDLENIEYESFGRTQHDILIHFTAMGTAVDIKDEHIPGNPILCLNLSSDYEREAALD